MVGGALRPESTLRGQLARAEVLNRPERIVLVVLIIGGVALDAGVIATSTGEDRLQAVLSIATTLTFALYLWSPRIATLALGVAVALAFVAGDATAALLAAAVATALVLRLGTTGLILGYSGTQIIAIVLYALGLGRSPLATGNVLFFVIIAVIAGGIGLALRMSYARGHRLERELVEQAEHEREAVLAERRWIAGELHDSIAHHLTIVALHVQLLDDDAARADSQEAIRGAARKALSDLRFVIQMAEEAPRGTETPVGDLADAIGEASSEFAAAGHAVSCDGDPADERIPRGVEIILARIVRESATNILKYAGPGPVHFAIGISPEAVGIVIRSPLPDVPRRDLPSTGTGLNRMAERVLGVSGRFSAGDVGSEWIVSAQLPTV